MKYFVILRVSNLESTDEPLHVRATVEAKSEIEAVEKVINNTKKVMGEGGEYKTGCKYDYYGL